MNKHPSPKSPARPSWLALPLLAAVTSLPAGQLSYHLATPVPGVHDVANLVGATADRDNLAGDGQTDGDYNDHATYVAFDRPHQGQTFTTGAHPTGYQIKAVWLRHVGYSANSDITWWCAPEGGALTLRVTRPAAAGTFAFVVASESVTMSSNDVGAPNRLMPLRTRENSPQGTGLWLRFAFASPVMLYPNTQYGFDVSAHGNELFFETLGVRDGAAEGGDAHAGGAAYRGATNGTPDNTLSPIGGDRVFIAELSPAVEVFRQDHEVFLTWSQVAGPVRRIELHRNARPTPEGRTRVAVFETPTSTHLDKVPDPRATYWYWLVVTRPDGGVENIGPAVTPQTEAWRP